VTLLEARDLRVKYGSREVLRGVSFTLEAGRALMLAGPNGAGKSTIVNALSGGAAYTGQVTCLGRPLASYRPAEAARLIGVLTQNHHLGYDFTAGEIVALGRYAHSGSRPLPGLFAGRSGADDAAVAEALDRCGLASLKNQPALTLSGGELQRVFLAQVFAQNPRVMLLDEPANHLDPIYQKQIFCLIRDWLGEGERAVLAVVHDLSLARAYGDDVLLLREGEAVAQGQAAEVLSPENLQATYAMDVYGWMRELLGLWA